MASQTPKTTKRTTPKKPAAKKQAAKVELPKPPPGYEPPDAFNISRMVHEVADDWEPLDDVWVKLDDDLVVRLNPAPMTVPAAATLLDAEVSRERAPGLYLRSARAFILASVDEPFQETVREWVDGTLDHSLIGAVASRLFHLRSHVPFDELPGYGQSPG